MLLCKYSALILRNVPHSAIICELAGDEKQRERAFSYCTFFELFGLAISVGLSSILMTLNGVSYVFNWQVCDCTICIDKAQTIDIACEKNCIMKCDYAFNKNNFFITLSILLGLYLLSTLILLCTYQERKASKQSLHPDFIPS